MTGQNAARVLICDDEQLFSNVMAAVLQDYTVQTASTGAQALELLPDFAPDLVLLDVEMKDLDGHEVCRRIRADPRFKFVKIVFVSGKVELADRIAGYRAGGDDYITKPFDNEEFLAKVRVLMRLKAVEEVDQIKQDFMSLISHETRTPLTSIRGLTELLLEGEDKYPAEERRGFLKGIYRSAIRLSELSEKTLLACRLSSKEQDVLQLTRPFSIKTLAEEALLTIEDAALEMGVDLQAEVEEVELNGNPSYLSKALSYVIDNAVRFTPAGGCVTITGSCKNGGYLLSVRDSGPGIPPDRLVSVFDLFSIKDVMHHKAGLGISLALAAKIIKLHGGRLYAENSPGGGATLVFNLPLSGGGKN